LVLVAMESTLRRTPVIPGFPRLDCGNPLRQRTVRTIVSALSPEATAT
jgi:hypothetical protein